MKHALASQFLIFDAEGKLLNHVPLPKNVGTPQDLLNVFKQHGVPPQMPKMFIVAGPGDDDRVGPEYFRALAKIGFHCALKYIPTIIGNEGAFRALREFIRHGIGDPEQFLTACGTIRTQDGPPGYILTAIAASGRQSSRNDR